MLPNFAYLCTCAMLGTTLAQSGTTVPQPLTIITTTPHPTAATSGTATTVVPTTTTTITTVAPPGSTTAGTSPTTGASPPATGTTAGSPTVVTNESGQQTCLLWPAPGATLWRTNQTLQLSLPSMEGEDVIWEASTFMQSGDVLLVSINDSLVERDGGGGDAAGAASAKGGKAEAASAGGGEAELSVYSATRAHDSCDLADTVLLDIAPMQIDGKRVIALYDKDLADGVNKLIVTSEAWGTHCVQLNIVVKSDNCGDNQDCSTKGLCFTNSSMDSYECHCCPGFIGVHCEEQHACYSNPCLNEGICVDLSQGQEGNTFQCLCPFGFTGKLCQETRSPCDSSPCQHGGQCQPSNETAQQFKCSCQVGYSGSLCQHNLDRCLSSPCLHGICVDQRDGYRCFCQPGFAGDQCQYEYNECESSPCRNGGTCTDHIGSFSCTCGRGYTGRMCNIKVDLCDPNPCSHHHYCVDKGNTYSCDCPKGFTGTDCLTPTKAACSANPCHNGGTCWSSIDSFYCACRPGFTGKICNEEVVFEVIPSSSSVDLGDGDQLQVAGGRGGADGGGIDLRMPITFHLDHLHNVYVAAGTLACALLIVLLTVAVCHCRMHETYKRCFLRATPLLPCNVTRLDSDLKPSRLDVEREHMQPLASRTYPAMDNSDMYYALDFSDSQSSPLIQ
ncbi:delta and Notch-like epidermal growth factor-related receptor [Nilaparvata lugens]|uniref:delta and Notch-like epidermal growth factor-related receptor n=1 Tax=Nilaparvata lugens TaxID=108931 RepID=UPI00193E3B99|nr:delta and Notch-like epidermal growth factor-related receptor [Nilaparvata lugens]